MKVRYKLFIRSIEKNKLILEKGIRKKKKSLPQWRTAKVVEMKVIVILVKVDEMYNILKSVLATV